MANEYQGDLRQSLSEIFKRELGVTIKEIESYQDEDNIWKIQDGIINSGGNLAIHIAGALQHFVGNVLGNTGYQRERDKEFSVKNISRSEIIDQLRNTIDVVVDTIYDLNDDQLNSLFPGNFRLEVNTSFMLIHLITHISWHNGQINYHRRLLDK